MKMDKSNRKEKILFALACGLYLAVVIAWIGLYDRSEMHTAASDTDVAAASENRNTMVAEIPDDSAGGSKAPDDGMVDWISVRGKTAEMIFHPIIEDAADQYDVESELIKAIIWAESSFNPNAVSNKGAVGLMQLMPATARAMGFENFSDPEINIEAGVRYFKQLMVQFDGNAELALAAYNAGSRKVREYKGIPPFETTRFYVKKVFEYYNGFKGGSPGDIGQI